MIFYEKPEGFHVLGGCFHNGNENISRIPINKENLWDLAIPLEDMVTNLRHSIEMAVFLWGLRGCSEVDEVGRRT